MNQTVLPGMPKRKRHRPRAVAEMPIGTVAPGLKKYDGRDAWFYRTFLCLCSECEEELDRLYEICMVKLAPTEVPK